MKEILATLTLEEVIKNSQSITPNLQKINFKVFQWGIMITAINLEKVEILSSKARQNLSFASKLQLIFQSQRKDIAEKEKNEISNSILTLKTCLKKERSQTQIDEQ